MTLADIFTMIVKLSEQGMEEVNIQEASFEAKCYAINELNNEIFEGNEATLAGLANAHESFLKDVADLLGCQPEEQEILARCNRAKGCFSG